MFERFTHLARRVVVLAQDEARTLHHNYIGTEHLLLALISEGEGGSDRDGRSIAFRVLRVMGVDVVAIRSQVEEIIGEGQSDMPGHIPFTPRAKKVLELTLREALSMGHNYIGTEHILLALIREGEGVAAQVLNSVNVDLTVTRQQVTFLLEGYVRQPDQVLTTAAPTHSPAFHWLREILELRTGQVLTVEDAEEIKALARELANR